ncbi:MAG: UvrD-helicase domain-containing protein, partial [Balneolales bacterium]|nr:UvrD-helicase domain-containing protein [Balneolales bacterium]
MAKEFNIFEVPFEGISLIEAGAGTGKTYNIAGLFVRAIIEKQLLPANILVLTYTEAATAELKQRLRDKLLNSIKTLEGANTNDAFLLELKSRYNSEVIPQLKRALYAFDEATISTIHGFCHRLLKEYSLEFGVNPGFEILPDEGELLQEVVDEYWREIFVPAEDEFQSALQHFFAAKGIYPEKLLNQIKPALDNPYAKRVPKIKSIQKFTDELGELKKAAVILKNTFSQNYSDLKLIVEGDALNGSLYRNKEALLDEISKWIKEFKVPDIPPEKLIRFGKFLPERGVKKNKTVPRLELYDAIDNYLEKHQAFSNVEVALYREAITRVYTNFAEKKDRLGVLGYNDLLTKVLDGIRSKSELAADIERRFPVGLIDEFQDTDIVQYTIFRAVYGNPLKSSLFLIGDPKQAIYRFRGADLNTYLKAKSEINDENIYTLSTNYRSEKSLIEAVNAFFKYKEEPFIKSNLDFIEARFPTSKEPREAVFAQSGKVVPSVQLISFNSKKAADQLRLEIAESIATEIVELLGSHIKTGEKRLTKKDIAVLTNTHFQANQIQETLKNRGLKSIIKSKESVFNTSEADELYRVLKAINDPENEPGIRAALGTELLGYRASEIRAFLDDPAKWTELTDQFFALNKLWLKNGFSAFSDALIKEMNLEKRLVS